MSAKPRTFDLVRYRDLSNVSGIGTIAQGTQFRDGQTVVQWCVPDMPRTIQVWDSLDDVIRIHGHGGETVVKFHDAA
jgi:hypothetical protein